MRSITYLTAGLIMIFVIVAIMIFQPEISTLAGIIMGGLTLVLIPIILYTMRKTPKRDKKHQNNSRY